MPRWTSPNPLKPHPAPVGRADAEPIVEPAVARRGAEQQAAAEARQGEAAERPLSSGRGPPAPRRPPRRSTAPPRRRCSRHGPWTDPPPRPSGPSDARSLIKTRRLKCRHDPSSRVILISNHAVPPDTWLIRLRSGETSRSIPVRKRRASPIRTDDRRTPWQSLMPGTAFARLERRWMGFQHNRSARGQRRFRWPQGTTPVAFMRLSQSRPNAVTRANTNDVAGTATVAGEGREYDEKARDWAIGPGRRVRRAEPLFDRPDQLRHRVRIRSVRDLAHVSSRIELVRTVCTGGDPGPSRSTQAPARSAQASA